MAKNYKNPARFRLDFIKENTFNRVWSLRMTRSKVILVTASVIAGGAALLWCIMAYTPMRQLLPGTLRGDLRNQYLEMALKLDSLEQIARINDAYISNIVDILNDKIPEDSAKILAAEQVYAADSLLAATEAEHKFVKEYEEEERFNLSVLAPIAAEGMIFGSPVNTSSGISDLLGQTGVALSVGRSTPVSSVYRGTVLDVHTASDGTSTVTVQHPNDFVSIYSQLGEVFVTKGKRVAAGQRIAHATVSGTPVAFELWHNGTALDPREYISF